ncbi:hypothetical protein BB561_001761 [Smittium simulii]|uniref:Endonuclease/exonuclease/phosphatase domain-containing protein n=1 Tax=Smittium simulii TaxID=133385 RepID=A0A2T9YT82_9FUNG|nr:hypothetical protein BB561_001761 [Smittium simulii]
MEKMQASQNDCIANIENIPSTNNVDLNFRKTIEAKKNGKKSHEYSSPEPKIQKKFESSNNFLKLQKLNIYNKKKLILWNISELKSDSVRKMVKIHTKICPDSIKISKKRQQNGEYPRFDIHKNNRQNPPKSAKKQPNLSENLTFFTYNIRGIKGCQHEFNELIRNRQPTVVAVQETLINKKSYRYRLPGYTVIESKSDHNLGGNGLLIALKNNSGLQIFELKKHPYWMSAKIIGKTTGGNKFTVIIINLHLPSAGIRKKDAILTLNRHVHKITENKPHQKLMILGDFIVDTDQVKKFIRKYGPNLMQCQVENSSGSRYNGLSMGRMLDHILYKDMERRPNYCTVSHKVDLSDHLPIQAEWGIESIIKTKKISKISPKIIEKHANVLLNHNRFAVLANKNADLDTLCSDTVATITDTLKVLQSVLIPIGTYGGELFGMSEVRTRPIQIIADKSLRLIANVSKATAINRLRTEFGISSINSICSRARERAYFKWPISKTWIADLIRQPLKSRSSTWVSGTLRWQKKYNATIEQGATRATIEARNVRNVRSRISSWLNKHKMQNSSNWISLQLLYPYLRICLNIIEKILSGAYWSTEQLEKSQLISKLYKKKCPCCNANFPETIEHILLGCSRWAAIRAETIRKFIPRLYKLTINNNNQPLMQDKIQLEKKSNVPLSMELETAKFMDGIRVPRALILDGIKCSPTPLN